MLPENQIICGDCLPVMRGWPDNCVDLVLTDPPYGINIVGDNGTIGGTSKEVSRRAGQINHKYAPIQNDDKPIDPSELLRVSQNQIIFGGNYIADKLPPSGCWIVWHKRAKNQRNNFADCELAWTSFNSPSRIFQHLWMGMLRDSEIQEHWHPTQKPIALMQWIIETYSNPDDIILDAYCGGGSVLVAAKMLGRRFIGIDISEEYCKIARMRLEAVETGISVAEQAAGQMSLFKKAELEA